MKNLFAKIFAFTIAAIIVPSALAQQPIYSTLGPGGAFDSSNPAQIIPDDTDGYADLFTSPITANVFSVSLALMGATPGATVSVSLREDAQDLPGNIIDLFASAPLPTEPGIATFDSITDFKINAGDHYWLTVVTSGGSTDWFYNSQGIDNATAAREPIAWSLEQSDGPALAFQINPVPEPASVALCGLGIASLFFVQRRKLTSPSHSLPANEPK
jgi:hypothetical protein